jgi:hypothetical protein
LFLMMGSPIPPGACSFIVPRPPVVPGRWLCECECAVLPPWPVPWPVPCPPSSDWLLVLAVVLPPPPPAAQLEDAPMGAEAPIPLSPVRGLFIPSDAGAVPTLDMRRLFFALPPPPPPPSAEVGASAEDILRDESSGLEFSREAACFPSVKYRCDSGAESASFSSVQFDGFLMPWRRSIDLSADCICMLAHIVVVDCMLLLLSLPVVVGERCRKAG